MIRKQQKFVRTVINIAPGKSGCYMPSSLGGRLMSVGKQAVSETKIFVIRQLQFSEFYSLVKLLIYGANSLVERDLWPVFEGHVIVRLFFKMFGSHSFPYQSLLFGTNIPNDKEVVLSIHCTYLQ